MAARKKTEEELSRAMIIEEATQQFLEQDYHQVSMRAIAKKLGCSHGAIYYHFSNKSELFIAVIEQYFNELNYLIDKSLTIDMSNDERILYLFMGFIRFGLDHQNQYRYMFVHSPEINDPLSHQASLKSYTKFSQALHQLASTPLNLFTVYATFIGLHGFVTHYLGRVTSFEDVYETAKQYSNYLKNALGNS